MDSVTIYNVGTRRYRVSAPLDVSSGSSSEKFTTKTASHGTRTNKTHRTTIPVARALHRFLIGQQGTTLSSIREVSHCKITVPRETAKSDTVELEGSEEEIQKAQELIDKVVKENLHKVAYTHFLSLPIGDLDVQRKVGEFQKDIHGEFFKCLSDSSFNKPATMHVTVGMLRLLTAADVQGAVTLLKSMHQEVYDLLGTRSLVVKIGNPAAMEANPSKARVIYLGLEDFEGAERVEKICELVRGRFKAAGLIDEERPLKIHATIMKAKRESPTANDESSQGPDDRRRDARINAVPMLRKYGELSFGTCKIGQIQIAKRFHFTEAGAYDSEGAIVLP
ncbi:activating signal cointegrator 1 complex subunit [Linderina macrospora]|uniref:Activating signal cointegrator 1 complex subunit n=1 Tax=Linderina macrospora TaxID=4868 RepID=A0ACC1J374_9FUNG|nr:activating signal cointegrator 1 complex subunit [Linderina macrospora]